MCLLATLQDLKKSHKCTIFASFSTKNTTNKQKCLHSQFTMVTISMVHCPSHEHRGSPSFVAKSRNLLHNQKIPKLFVPLFFSYPFVLSFMHVSFWLLKVFQLIYTLAPPCKRQLLIMSQCDLWLHPTCSRQLFIHELMVVNTFPFLKHGIVFNDKKSIKLTLESNYFSYVASSIGQCFHFTKSSFQV